MPRAPIGETFESFNPEPSAKAERADTSVSAGPVGTCIGALAPDTFAVGSGLNDSVWAACGMTRLNRRREFGPNQPYSLLASA